MPKITKTFLLMHTEPEAAIKAIRAAYKKCGTMAKAADELGVSVSQLRVQCRRLGFDPVEQRKAEQKRTKKNG